MHPNDILSYPNLQQIKARHMAKIDKRGPSECWPWIGARKGRGYGHQGINGFQIGAHTLSYLFYVGKFPENYGRGKGNILCRHTCDNVWCVNPKHIVLGNHVQNMGDAIGRKRLSYGMDRADTKLTDEQVRAIRSDPRKQRDIAADYGVRQGHVSRIKLGERRKTVV